MTRRRRCIRLVGLRTLAAILSVLLLASTAPASAQVTGGLTNLTLQGSGVAGLFVATGYTGMLSAEGLGVPLQEIEVLLDGNLAAKAQTATDGSYAVDVIFDATGRHDLQAVAYRGADLEVRSDVVSVHVAPATDPTVATTLFHATEFLYSGTDPVQTGVEPGVIKAERVAVLRSDVSAPDGTPVSDVDITIKDHPELGVTQTRADGAFNMAVNGGGPLTVSYEKEGFLPVHRNIDVPWQDYVSLPDVVMTRLDDKVTTVDLSSAEPVQVARGSEVGDDQSARTATLMIFAGTSAEMTMPDGSSQPLSTLDVRATEYTVGQSGPEAMPAPLPASSAYTYAVELSVDEALTAGATDVRFDHPVVFYLENFLDFPVGGPVPTAYYDRADAAWVPSDDGRIAKIVSITDGKADLDVDGDDVPDGQAALDALGITDAERAELAQLYGAGQSLWRVTTTHFSPFDHNWPFIGPDGAVAPVLTPPSGNSPEDQNCKSSGSIIECQSQVLGESVPIAGTPFSLNYRSDRIPGGRSHLDIPLSGASVPATLKRIELDVFIAGTRHHKEFPPDPDQAFRFEWDRKDAYGRIIQGAQQATVTVSYVYDGGRYCEPGEFRRSFGQSCITPLEAPTRVGESVLSQTWRDAVGPTKLRNWDARGQGLGGWTLDIHHAYDPGGRVLYMGSGERRSAQGANRIVIDSVAPPGALINAATSASVGSDGSIYIADTNNHRVRKVDPTGTITTVAGDGTAGFGGDGGAATLSQLSSPEDVAIAEDGSLYIADTGNHRIRKISPDGIITTIAGTGQAGFAGEGGPAIDAKLSSPTDVELTTDGAYYIADKDNHRIRLVGSTGTITTFAGSSFAGFGGDGGPATSARLWEPRETALGTAGDVFIADTRNHRVRRVAADGTITTFAGTGTSSNTGNDGLATLAAVDRPAGVDVGPDASVYISTLDQIRRVGTDGIITKFAGGSERGDNIPATSAEVRQFNGGVTVTGDGVVLIASASHSLIRRVGTDGLIGTVAGTGASAFAGDGGPATSWRLSEPEDIAIAPNGTMYVADTRHHRVVRVSPQGDMTVVAGTGVRDYSGDGGPATEATLWLPSGVALGPDGSIYIADSANAVIRRVAPDGIITTFAGDGNWGFGGDGGPASQASLSDPRGVEVAPDGTVYISDTGNNRVRRVSTGGIITTFAGNGSSSFSGDGGPATSASIGGPFSVAFGPDGSVYIPEEVNDRIRRVDSSGTISTVVGSANACTLEGDGGPATEAGLCSPHGVDVGPDGSLYVADRFMGAIRGVDPEGTISTIAGGGTTFGDGGPAAAATLAEPEMVALHPDGDVYVLDTERHLIRRVGLDLEGFDATERIIPSGDGSELYVFNPQGRHLRTLDALTNAIRYQFSYNEAGLLVAIEDADGNSTTIERDGAGNPTAILSPYGQRTELGLTGDGFLSLVRNAAGEEAEFTYSDGGLLASFTDPRENTHRFTFNNVGRLLKDEGPAEGFTTLDRSGTAADYTVTKTTAEGRVTTFRVVNQADGDHRRVVTAPSGAKSEMLVEPSGKQTITSADGSATTTRIGPDPRWGMLAPLVTTMTTQTPSGRSATVKTERSVTLSNPDDLLALATQTDKVTINNRVSLRTYDAASRTVTEASPEGRRRITGLDAKGRVTSVRTGELQQLTVAYEPRGRIATITQGSGTDARTTTFDYDTAGFLAGVSDPVGRASAFQYDSIGRVLTEILPDQQEVNYDYDRAGNLTSLTPPGREAHAFTYTPIDLQDSYTAPDAGPETGRTTAYSYNLDGQVKNISQPGNREIVFGYDGAGRLASLGFSRGTTTYGYDATTSKLSSLTAPGGDALTYQYDGFLTTSTEQQGSASATVAYDYDANLRGSSRSINGGAATAFAYDKDSLITSAGALSLDWDQSALLTGTNLDQVATAAEYNGFGEPVNETASFEQSTLYEAAYLRDKLGRITQKTEVIGGQTSIFDYEYDSRGRLVTVTKDGVPYRSYTYDGNGNRLTASEDGGAAISASHDAQDRLTSYSNATYTYTPDGQLKTKSVGPDTTTYTYDELGNLTNVELPDKTIDYVVDGLGRRVAKKVDGAVTDRWVYGQGIQPIAELNASGGIKSQFVYASRIHVPDLMIKNGTTYRLIHDQLGSVRLVVNTSDGSVAQRIDYDPFGKVLTDTNPSFQPFGFAGGLYDAATGLVRFGARDYDATTGRFTAKDPILFMGGDTNLYTYVGGEPVNRIDPRGLDWLDDLNDSVGGLVDGLTTIPFTNISLMENLRDHMVGGGLAVDVNKCSWGYGYAHRIGQLEQAGLLAVAGAASAASSATSESTAIGGRITGYTGHGINSAISHDGVGVSTRAILNTVRNPLEIISQSGGRLKIIGKDAVVVLNESGKVITTWARNSGAWRVRP